MEQNQGRAFYQDRAFPPASFPDGPYLKVDDIAGIPGYLYQLLIGTYYIHIVAQVQDQN